MNYYQKYQKYKFKYLNLLNQSGGDEIPYTEEDFILLDKFLDNSNLTDEELEKLKYYKDENDYLKYKGTTDLLIDAITVDFINIKNAVLIDKQVYDANSLFKSIISGHKKILHTRGDYSLVNLVDIRNKLDNDDHKNFIKNLILSKFTGNVQNLLNQLEPEQLKIFFTKINIIEFENSSTILFLINYLLENNITNISYKFKNDLRTNYKLLILVPENKMTYEICMIAVKTSSYALKYIPKDNIMELQNYYEICWEAVNKNGLILKYASEHMKEIYGIIYQAVTNNGLALEFVPEKKKTFGICEIAVTKNGLALEFVPDIKKTFDICSLAVTKNGLALEFVSIYNITLEEYYNLCEKAIKNKSTTFNYVKADNMTPEQYYELYKKALENNKHIFNGIPENKRTYEIYMLAVTKYGKHLENVKLNDNITLEQYYELCEKAVENYGEAIFYVKTEVINENNENNEKYYKPKYMTPEQYYKLCEKALTEDGYALEYVNKNIKNITSDQYYKLYEIAVTTCGKALEFIPKTLIDNTTPFKYKPKNMTDEQYYELCKKAVTNNGFSISYIPNNIIQNMGKEKYSEIRELAIANNINVIPYAKSYENVIQYIQNSMNR